MVRGVNITGSYVAGVDRLCYVQVLVHVGIVGQIRMSVHRQYSLAYQIDTFVYVCKSFRNEISNTKCSHDQHRLVEYRIFHNI